MNNLTVVCFYWGNWCAGQGVGYVNKLYNAVQRYLSIPHKFVCFTDLYNVPEVFSPGIKLMPIGPNWKWNLRKMIMYRPSCLLEGRILSIDLDVIITGSLDEIAAIDVPFVTCAGPYKRYLNKVGGSITAFDVGFGKELWNTLLDPNQLQRIEKITRGSERRYYEMMLDKKDIKFWDELLPGQILSYKREVGERNTPPIDTRIIWFHGSPRPHERLELKWVRDNWK